MATATKKAKPDAGGDNTQSAAPGVTLTMIRLSDLFPSPTNPRKTFPESALKELSDSIRANGVINPITVRLTSAGYEVVSGGRRYRAAIMAELLEMPCIIRDLSDDQVLDIQIEENLHRADVPPLEEAAAFHDLLTSKKLSVGELAGRLNKSESYVYRRLKLTQLHESYRQHVESGALPTATAEVIASYPEEVQKTMYKKTHYADGERVTFLDTRSLKNKFKWEACTDLKKAIWPLDRAELQPGLQSCSTCEKNTAVATLLFPDGADEPKCTDKACWKVKESVWKALCLKEWEAYNAEKGQVPKYADLHYYEMNDKKEVVKVLDYEPEVIGKYSYEVVEQGEPGAFEVLFVGAELYYQEERDKNYTRGWIRLNGKSTSAGGNQDWEMRRIDEMDIPENEKQVLRDELIEKRRIIAEASARHRQEQDWRRAIVEAAHIQFTSGITSPEALIQLLRLHIRASVGGHGLRGSWLDMFGKWAAEWKPQSFAVRVNGEGEGGKTNPTWTKGAEKEWKLVLSRHQRKGEYGTMDERAWSDWISEADKSEFLDAIIISLTPFEVVAMFADLSLRHIADRVAGYNRELYDINIFRFVCEATAIDMAALKPELNVTDDDAEDFEDESDEFDSDFEANESEED